MGHIQNIGYQDIVILFILMAGWMDDIYLPQTHIVYSAKMINAPGM